MKNAYKFDVYEGKSGLLSIQTEWEKLYAKSIHQSFYNDWRWHFALLNNGLVDNVIYLMLKAGATAIAIIPLQNRRDSKQGKKMPYRVLGFPKHSHIVLSDIVIDPDHASPRTLQTLLHYMQHMPYFSWQRLEFLFPERSNAASLFQGQGLKRIACNKNAYFDCSTEAALKDHVSAKMLRNINRLKNKAEKELPDLSVREISAADEIEDAVEKFLQTEASGWKGENNSAILKSRNITSFYKELASLFAANNQLRINLLRSGDNVVAAQFCIVTGKTFYILKIGYDEGFKHLGAGNILLKDLLQKRTVDKNIREVNLVTSPLWAKRWHPRQDLVYMAFGYRKNLPGKLLQSIFKFSGLEDRLIEHYKNTIRNI